MKATVHYHLVLRRLLKYQALNIQDARLVPLKYNLSRALVHIPLSEMTSPNKNGGDI